MEVGLPHARGPCRRVIWRAVSPSPPLPPSPSPASPGPRSAAPCSGEPTFTFSRRPAAKRARLAPAAAAAAAPGDGLWGPDGELDLDTAPGLAPPRRFAGQRQRRGPGAAGRAGAALLAALGGAELARRAGVTLGVLLLFRLGHYIPLPGAGAAAALAPAAAALSAPHAPGFAGMAATLERALAGGLAAGEAPASVLQLSIAPLMTAHLLVGVAGAVAPDFRRHLARLRDEGRAGRDAINGYITGAFAACAAAQAWAEAAGLVPGAAGVAARVRAAVSLAAGAGVCRHLVQTLDAAGLGDGAGVVIGAGIALGYSRHLAGVCAHLAAARPGALALAAAAAPALALVWACAAVQGAELRLPLTFYRRRQARAAPFASAGADDAGGGGGGGGGVVILAEPGGGGRGRVLSRGGAGGEGEGSAGGAPSSALPPSPAAAEPFLPLKLSPNGTRQLLFANFWAALLAAPAAALGLGGALASPAGFAALVLLLEAWAPADATPRELAAYLQLSDAGVRGLSPGLETERFLGARLAQLRLLSGAFVAAVSLAARAADAAAAALVGVEFGCLSLLLLASTVLSAARQADAARRGPQLEARIAAERAELAAAGGLWGAV